MSDSSKKRIAFFAQRGQRFAVISQSIEPVRDLTAAEQDVCRMLLDGATDAAIAERRGTSVRTVGNQIQAIYRKLGVSDRLELLALLLGPTSSEPAKPIS